MPLYLFGPGWRKCAVCLGVAILGLLTALSVFWSLRGVEEHSVRDAFHSVERERFVSLEASIRLSVHDLVAIRSHFDSSGNINRENFARFTSPVLKQNEAVQAFEWIPLVPRNRRADYLEAARKDGFPAFDFKEFSPHGTPPSASDRRDYFPIYFVEPYQGNEPALGYDVGSNAIRREAIESAARSGDPTTTGRIVLVQDFAHQYGVLIFLPVYRDGSMPATEPARREALIGFVTGVFRLVTMIQQSRPTSGDSEGIGVAVFDQDAPPGEKLLYPSNAPFDDVPQVASTFKASHRLSVGGRHWEIVVYALPDAFKVNHTGSNVALVGGILGALFGTAYLRAMMTKWYAVNEIVADRTTELTKLNKELEASEARYRELIDLSPDAIIVGEKHKIALANKASLQLFQVASAEHLIGRRMAEFVPPRLLVPFQHRVDKLYAGEAMAPLHQCQIVRHDGSVVDVEIASCSVAVHGEMVALAVIRNVMERKLAQAEQARLFRAIEQTNESVVITDAQGAILYGNPALEKASGYSREEVIGRNPRIFKSGHHDADFYRQMWTTLLAGQTWSGRLVNQRKDGSLFEEDATISPIRDEGGTIVNYVAVKRDVTEETLLKHQLYQAQKMEAVGRLAGGVAHDFNNLLMVISGYTELLQSKFEDGDPVRRNTDAILKAADRAGDLTRQLLAFSRKQVLSLQVVDLNNIIADTAKMIHRLIGEDIEFDFLRDPSLWAVRADPGQISQVLVNLCINGRDAMPSGGRLVIETQNVIVDRHTASRYANLTCGRYTVVVVSDTGKGMPKDVQDKVFEPFFTTKERGKGTGLGLATVYGIVKQSGGYIHVESEVGTGTRFILHFPATADPLTGAEQDASPAEQGHGELLLVAEDEDSLRKLITGFLEGQGYRVLSARNGEEALALAEQHPDIDLLLTDVIMPKMGGVELAERLAERSRLRTLFISGYTDDSIASHGDLRHGAELIQKPISLTELTRKLRSMLAVQPAD